MTQRPEFSAETLLAQGGGGADPATGALAPSIQPSVTFGRDAAHALRNPVSYGREGQANWRQVEALLAALEGGEDALLFPSGSAAATALLLALRPGEHVVIHDGIYYEFAEWIGRYCADHGVALDRVDASDPEAVRRSLHPGRTRLVWIETPTNPTWRTLDIRAVAEVVPPGALLVVDSTAATPVLTRPVEHGADLVLHSATKYLNGHDDVMAGALVARERGPYWERVRAARYTSGALPGAMEAWLLLRGMRTLAVRVAQASRTAARIAEAMAAHPAVERVLYPGLPGDPGHAVARRQMRGGFGGMLSLLVRGDAERALAVCGATRLFHRATSFGSTASLVEHRRTIEGDRSDCPPNLLRLSVGLEGADDLLDDLRRALDAPARGASEAPEPSRLPGRRTA